MENIKEVMIKIELVLVILGKDNPNHENFFIC